MTNGQSPRQDNLIRQDRLNTSAALIWPFPPRKGARDGSRLRQHQGMEAGFLDTGRHRGATATLLSQRGGTLLMAFGKVLLNLLTTTRITALPDGCRTRQTREGVGDGTKDNKVFRRTDALAVRVPKDRRYLWDCSLRDERRAAFARLRRAAEMPGLKVLGEAVERIDATKGSE